METAKVFKWADNQAICLHIDSADQNAELEPPVQSDDILIRTPRRTSVGEAIDALASMPEGFYTEVRYDPPPETREDFDEFAMF